MKHIITILQDIKLALTLAELEINHHVILT